jgi:hypothetical protein
MISKNDTKGSQLADIPVSCPILEATTAESLVAAAKPIRNAANENKAMIKPFVYPLNRAPIKMIAQIISSTTFYFFALSEAT